MNDILNPQINPIDVPQMPVVEKAAPLTREQKLEKRIELLKKRIAADQEELPTVEAELNAILTMGNVEEGATVEIWQGRGETRRTVIGKVIGVKTEEDGAKRYKVQHGSGFDADIAVIGSGSIVAIL